MGRHAKEGHSPAPAASAPLAGRHRADVRHPDTSAITISGFFRRSRHSSRREQDPNEFPEPEGATPGWGGTLQGMRAVTPAVRPRPLVEARATGPVPLDQLFEPDSVLEPPTHYRLLVPPPARSVTVSGTVFTGGLGHTPGV